MSKKKMRAFDALQEAQKIAFAPFIFQTVVSLKKLGALDVIFSSKDGVDLKEISAATSIGEYGLGVLLEMAESSDIVFINDKGGYELTKIGYFLNSHPMTEVNMNFTNDICYKGLFHLREAIETGKPEGLKELGDWPNIYHGLSKLKDDQQRSWFAFDHHYSDEIFQEALNNLLEKKPGMVYDIGGNTGKFAIACCTLDKNIKVRIFDLPGQLKKALENANSQGFTDRISGTEIDWLAKNPEIPKGADIIWMCQFLDCFSKAEILKILSVTAKAMDSKTELIIIETFTDRQKFGSSKLVLEATSLYFTAIANGNSKMYRSADLIALLDEAGLTLDADEQLGEFHTMLRCCKK